jgi:ribokinase
LVSILILNEVEASDMVTALCAEKANLTTMATVDVVHGSKMIAALICELFQHLLGVVITLGEHGALAQFRTTGNQEWDVFEVAAFPTQVLDTTGAGDTFIGYFIATLGEELASRSASVIEHALRRAALASSMACSRAGAMDSIPMLAEVIQREMELGNK